MKGLIVRNNFLYTPKFSEHTELFERAFADVGVCVEVRSNAEFLTTFGDGFGISGLEFLPDFVLFWDKDVNLARSFELLGARVFNSSECIELCDSKIKTQSALAAAGIPTPETVVAPFTYDNVGYTDARFLKDIKIGYPMVAKKERGSFGQQVALAENARDAERLLKEGARIFQRLLIGTDLRLNVAGGKVVSAVSRKNDGDFRANAALGGVMKNYRPTQAQTSLALRAAQAVGADFCGVDIIAAERDCVVEVNGNPHFKNALEATGDDMARHIVDTILKSL